MSPLPTLGGPNGFAAGANNLGQIVGWAENVTHDTTCVLPQYFQFEPVVYGPAQGQIQQLPNYPGDPDGSPGNVINCQCIQLAAKAPKE